MSEVLGACGKKKKKKVTQQDMSGKKSYLYLRSWLIWLLSASDTSVLCLTSPRTQVCQPQPVPKYLSLHLSLYIVNIPSPSVWHVGQGADKQK